MTNKSPEQTVTGLKDEKKEVSLANLSMNQEVFLQTSKVKLKNREKTKIVRAILDSGSQRSYVVKQEIEDMKYKKEGEHQVTHVLFGRVKTTPQNHKSYLIHLSSIDNRYSCNFIALDQETICSGATGIQKGPWLQELSSKNIKLTDIVQDVNEPITVLIGADILGKLFTGKIVNLNGGLTAVETKLGWTLMGKKLEKNNCRNDTALMVMSMFVQQAEIADLWRLDILGITDPAETKSKNKRQEVVTEFRRSVKINEENRYEVCLPWKENHPVLSDNKELARRRLLSTTGRLEKEGLLQEYDQVFQEWLREGIIEKVTNLCQNKSGHYLLHRHVVKENSTTRIRPVFDASANTKNKPSLNQCLKSGPNLIELIPAVLLRFREKQVGVIADIRRAFLQISVTQEDRDVLKFLWWNNLDERSLQEYRHARVVFGVTSSPFLLAAVITLHLESIEKEVKFKDMVITVDKLKQSFYVDNCVTSIDTSEELHQFKEEATTIIASGSFDLRGWEYSGCETPNKETPVLGITWDKIEDTLMLRKSALTEELPKEITKRAILAASHKIFDPLGFACPALLCPKLILQTITSLGWDTEVNQEVKKKFIEWHEQLECLESLKIPRWMGTGRQENESTSFHVFVDASSYAYAVVIYARTQSRDKVEVQPVQAKSRVAPTNKTTISRLELLAATVGARLMKVVLEALGKESARVYFWSDPTTVLTWIHHHRQWAVFVYNRVKEIRQLTDPSQWRHVPGNINPANLPSRGCTPTQLVKSKWWEGPKWLKDSPEKWPMEEYVSDEVEVSREVRKTPIAPQICEDIVMIGTLQLKKKIDSSWYTLYFSKYIKIVRLVAWMLRFEFNSQTKDGTLKRQGEVSSKEFEAAEWKIMKLVQQESFMGMTDPNLHCLKICTDKFGVMRMISLVANRKDNYGFRQPIILDLRHLLVTRLIEQYHKKLQHAGVLTVMNQLREKYWILTGRRAVRAVLDKCITCKRYKSKHYETIPAILPKDRVRDAAVFEITGVDLAGPLYLRGNVKSWVCLFTCAVYRAIHLELITSLSTEAFIEAMRRFIARRGRPAVVYSDNGTNFVGVVNLFKQIDWRRIQEFSIVQEIDWRFNPPSAAWWGGWWEQLVRTIEELLRKVLKKSCLTYEEMSTTLCDCEAIINSRPITYLSDDVDQPAPLTPASFLQDIKQVGVPDLDQVERANLKERIHYRQKVKDDLRRRFRSEYLGQLFKRQSTKASHSNVQVGEVVLIGDDKQKRLDWPLATVVEVIPGRDGNVRVVRLKTANGELIRPLQRVYPLEVIAPSDIKKNDAILPCDPVNSTEVPESSLKKVEEPFVTPKVKDVGEEKPVQTRSGRSVKQTKKLNL